MSKTCDYIKASPKSSFCTNCQNYINHETTNFYKIKYSPKHKTRFNYCPNCGAKIINRINKEVEENE